MPMKIWMKFKELSLYGGTEQDLENITEIHFNFKTSPFTNRIAFESDVESSGCVYDLSDIDEFEAIDNIMEKKENLLNVRNEIIDVISDVEDHLRDYEEGVIVNAVVKRLCNSLDIMNEVLDDLGINEDYVPDS